jgi:PAS domain S-box-containing protein
VTRSFVYVLRLALLFAVYAGTAYFGLRIFDAVGGIATAVWPPTGIALVALSLGGYRLWPGIALAAFWVNWWVQGAPWYASCGMAVGNTIEAVVGTYLLRRVVGFRGTLDRLRHVVGLVLLAALCSTLVSATIGVASGWLGGVFESAKVAEAWWTWWIGDMIGDLVLAPFLFVWCARPRIHVSRAGLAEAAALFLCVLGVSLLVFTDALPVKITDHPFLLFPFLIWAALRFGQPGAVTATFVMSVIAIWGTHQGWGPFIRPTRHESLLLLQSFMAIAAMTTLVLAAVVSERRRAQEGLAKSREELEERVRERTAELRKQTSLVQLLHAVATTANQALSVEDAMQASVDLICAHIGWPVGHVYILAGGGNGALIPSTFWHLGDRERFEPFRRGTLRSRPEQRGLAGRVHAGLEPLWLENLGTNPAFDRAELAQQLGLRTGLSFPVLVGMDVVAVQEFFTTEVIPRDEALLVAMSHLGNQLGRVVERSQARDALQESEARFRSVAQAAPEAIFSADEEGVILSWNRGAQTTFGYTEDEALGQPLTMLLLERQREALRLAIVERVTTTPSRLIGRTQEFHGLRKDGSDFPLELSLSKWRTGKGTFFSGIIRDISARKRAEDSLRMSEAMFKGLFSAAPDALVVSTREGRIFRINGQAEKTFGYRENELLGENEEILLAERFRAEHAQQRITYLTAPRPSPRYGPFELNARRKDGQEFPVDITLGTLQTDRHMLVVATVRDITKRKHAEEALREAHDKLEMRVKERTAALAAANEALMVEMAKRELASEQIKASLKEKEMLLREVHHRVKNNLQVISSLLTIQSQRIKDPQTLAIFKESQNRVRSIAAIHQKLVRSSDLAHIDFAEYIQHLVIDLFRSYGVDSERIQLTIDVDDISLGIDTAIPCALVINELVTNSLKHAFPNGLGEISIALRGTVSDGYLLTVRDDGVSFPEGFRIDKTDSLGLQIVQALTEQLDGTLEVATGAGTTFQIRFKELQYSERK